MIISDSGNSNAHQPPHRSLKKIWKVSGRRRGEVNTQSSSEREKWEKAEQQNAEERGRGQAFLKLCYRSCFLLHSEGFSLGHTTQSHTKGIWMWCMPHPKKPDHTLVLLDTEGFGDTEKGDNENDSWIFALAILLSSTIVYNTLTTINQQALDKLQYPSLWSRIALNLGNNSFILQQLQRWASTDQKSLSSNELRLCIRKFFPIRKCFVFDPPALKKHLKHLDKQNDKDLERDFIEQVAEFRSYILSQSSAKTVSDGIIVNGPYLENLVQTYVSTINNEYLPCMENTALLMAPGENLAVVQKAMAHYDHQMSQKVQLPTETLEELLDLHRACEREAIEIFTKNAFKDVDNLFRKELGDQLEAKRDYFCNKNVKASSDCCKVLLQDIFGPLEEDVKQGKFSKPEDYHLFIQKKQELKKKYYQTPKKGIQAEEMLKKCLQSIEDMADEFLEDEQSLTEKGKD
ncbi:Interferon-induced guanylate-binding protein 2 [Tupaia chinensis]|uniref:Interferon-induced guanylate-binding protein 2 n=1 Tax=Tupaia chinensis TaxID=246437 RepID=L9LC56_TUPCH|nr:Interferon-induced guanylate-binding protein 2 [Tupaia chinensis]